MKNVKLAVLISALVGASAAFAQQTPPAKPVVKSTQIAQGAGAAGGASTGAAASTSGAAAAGAVTTEGLVGIAAAATATVGLQSTAKH